VYVNDIVITRDDMKGIDSLNKYLQKHFQTKDLEFLKNFLGIEVTGAKKAFFYHRESIYPTGFQKLGC